MRFNIDKDPRGYYVLSSGNGRYCKVLSRFKTYEQALEGIDKLNKEMEENRELIISGLKRKLDKLDNEE